MILHLEKPLVIFDIETTGLEINSARIIQISGSKLFPREMNIDPSYIVNYFSLAMPKAAFSYGETKGLKELKFNILINPGVHIENSDIHGITDEDVKDMPYFKNIVSYIYDLFCESDLGGFNSNSFDIPLLAEEFLRCQMAPPFDEARLIDAFKIFRQREKRDLKAAIKFYLGLSEDEIEASGKLHDASTDAEYTKLVLFGQLDRYDIERTAQSLEKASMYEDEKPVVDYARKLVYNEEGDIVYNIGKDKGLPVEDYPSFANWMLNQSWLTLDTRGKLQQILRGQFINKMKGQKNEVHEN